MIKLTAGLFNSRNILIWLHDLKVFFHRIKFLLTYGYAEQFTYDTFNCFLLMMEEVLTNYRDNRMSTPTVENEFWDTGTTQSKLTEQELQLQYTEELDKAINYLNTMNIDRMQHWPTDEERENIFDAKAKFFAWLSSRFYDLWD